MTDKKTVGSFIKSKRAEKNYSQKDLAEMLFVTEGAVSKWERGVSYPDITLISDICRVLIVSEHELITATNDTTSKTIKKEAQKFRTIRSVWFLVPTIAYAVALLTCFICNLAVNHTLSWFFVVLSSLLCAYSFVPTFTLFFKSNKLPVFVLTSFCSICLLLYTCAAYTNTLYWALTACIGVLIGYCLLFLPILLAKTKLSRYKFLISLAAALVSTVLLLANVNRLSPFMLTPAIMITCYGFAAAILCAFLCTLRFDAFLKTGICIALSSVAFYFTEYLVDILFGTNDAAYKVDFSNWSQCLEGNIQMLCLIAFLFISIIFLTIGIFRICKRKK